MNSDENNEKQIQKLERMERIYADEKKHESIMSSIETEDEDLFASARKIFKWALFITWGACAVTLFTGGDFSVSAAAILFTGGIYAALCVTKFLHQKKIWDVIVSVLVAVGAIGLGIILLTANTQY